MDYGIVVDLETTGLDAASDKIIEIGILEFAIEDGKAPVITQMYSALEDPGIEIPAEIEKITGISTALVTGQKIDWEVVNKFFARSSIAIAHNAAFDTGFLRQRNELDLEGVHWACSCKHINWQSYGFKSKSLNYLACDHGFINPFAHRALFDAATTFRVIAPYMNELIERSYEREVLVSATYSPFETKDKLRARGYHWESDKRVWQRTILASDLEDERGFLRTEIYRGDLKHHEEEIRLDA